MEDQPQSDKTAGDVAVTEPADDKGSHVCLNCGTDLRGKYCHQCGQMDLPIERTLRDILSNFISSFWSYEGKFWLTTRNLMFRPGQIAKDYVEGKRERYFHPARMYVFISFVFFLVLAMIPPREISPAQQGDKPAAKGYTFESFGVSMQIDRKYKSVAAYDSAQALLPDSQRDHGINHYMSKKEIELVNRYKTNEEFQQAFGSAYSGNISKVFFWLLPVFALLLKLFFGRSKYHYAQHLTFSVYLYDFFFMAASILLLAGYITTLTTIADVLLYSVLAIYFVIAVKKMYEESWTWILVKTVFFFVLLSVCLSLGLLINLGATIIAI